MKKIILGFATVLALSLISCGKSACDCLKAGEELTQRAVEANGDVAVLKTIAEEVEAMKDDCKDFTLSDYGDCK